MFREVNGVVLKPLPFENPAGPVGIWHTAPGLNFDEANQSLPMLGVPPLPFDEGEVFMGIYSDHGIGRLRTDATVAQANADVARMVPTAIERYPGGLTLGMLEEPRFGGLIRPLQEDVAGDVGSVLWLSHLTRSPCWRAMYPREKRRAWVRWRRFDSTDEGGRGASSLVPSPPGFGVSSAQPSVLARQRPSSRSCERAPLRTFSRA